MNQWPKIVKYKFQNKKNFFSKNKLSVIENYFSKKYKSKYSLLCPSARSSINLILSYLKFDRSKIVNIPKWSSHCLFQTIGAKTNISINNFKSDCVLVVHKWGNTYKYTKNKKNSLVKIIDDSADSLPNEKFIPFENNSNFEIISLPKIIGSYSGGIILTNNKNFYDFAKIKQLENKRLGFDQSKKKYNYIFSNSKNNNNWFYEEAFNTSFDGNVIDNILNCMKYFEYNLNLIKQRQKVIKEIFPQINFDNKRVGPCSIFPEKKFYFFKNLLPIYFFDFSKDAKKEKFEKCFILPIHFGLQKKEFEKKIINMNRIYKLNK